MNQPIFFDSETKAALVKLAGRMDDLIGSIEGASKSADRSARWLIALTVILVVLTVAIVGLTAVLIYNGG